MEYNKIIAVTGKPGLFEVVSQTKTGVIVESLVDKKRFPVVSSQNISMLENIAIYTYEEEVLLLSVFKTIFEKLHFTFELINNCICKKHFSFLIYVTLCAYCCALIKSLQKSTSCSSRGG